jgi:hypothetical protein
MADTILNECVDVFVAVANLSAYTNEGRAFALHPPIGERALRKTETGGGFLTRSKCHHGDPTGYRINRRGIDIRRVYSSRLA